MLSASEITSMSIVVASSLDVSMTFSRDVKGQDGYGHTTATGTTTVGPYKVNVTKPSATQLQAYAGIIGSQAALMLRFMPTSDIREGDRVTYLNAQWLVQYILNAESYSFANDALITSVQ